MIEQDEAKRVANLRKHDVDFSIVDLLEWSEVYVSEEVRRNDGEQRWIAMAPYRARLCVIVDVLRGDKMRVISAR